MSIIKIVYYSNAIVDAVAVDHALLSLAVIY